MSYKKFCKCGCKEKVNPGNLFIWGHNKGNKKYYFDENYFEKIDNPEKAYILGYFTGDGCIPKEKTRLSISTTKDKEILFKILEQLKAKNPIKKVPRYNKEWNRHFISWRINFCSKKLVNDLKKYGIVPQKSFKTFFPDKLIPEKYWRDYIRGVFDADGCISKRKEGRFNITGNIRLIKKIQIILIKQCVLNKRKLKLSKNNFISGISYSGINNCRKIYDYLYYKDCLCLERKLKIWRKIL